MSLPSLLPTWGFTSVRVTA